MLKVVLLVCVLVALVAGDCGVLERQVIKTQWSRAYGIANDREKFGEELWQQIFNAAPDARGIFDRVRGDNIYSKEFRAHALRVLGGLDMCIGLLDDQPSLSAQLAHLKGQHIERKIPDAYFEAFKSALMNVLHDHIGSCFNFDAWNVCLDSLNAGIKGGS